jgi:hypothetical protein
MPVDYSQSALVRYTDVIVSSELQEELDEAVITFGPPRPTTKYGYNTRAVAKVYKGTRLRNCIALYLDRLDLATFFTDRGIATISAPGALTSHDTLSFILSEYGINLTTDDIVLDNLADTDFTLTAKTTSLGWLGSYQFNATVDIYPPLYRTSGNRLYVTSSGKFIRRSIPAYNP